ncbi:hypothetical protein P4O66_020076, partial [Electrophorus voltai]
SKYKDCNAIDGAVMIREVSLGFRRLWSHPSCCGRASRPGSYASSSYPAAPCSSPTPPSSPLGCPTYPHQMCSCFDVWKGCMGPVRGLSSQQRCLRMHRPRRALCGLLFLPQRAAPTDEWITEPDVLNKAVKITVRDPTLRLMLMNSNACSRETGPIRDRANQRQGQSEPGASPVLVLLNSSCSRDSSLKAIRSWRWPRSLREPLANGG